MGMLSKKMLALCYFLCGLHSAFFAVRAQNLKSDFEAMQTRYKSVVNFYTQATITANVVGAAAKNASKHKTEINKRGEDFLYSVDDKTILINAGCVLVIDHDQKIIVYQKREINTAPIAQAPAITPQIDSLLSIYNTIEYKGSANGQKRYFLTIEDAILYQMELYFSEETLFLEKTVCWYKNEETEMHTEVTTEYKNTDTNPVFTADLFSEKKYVQQKGANLQPQHAYKAYELIIIPND
jgi:outer membrane lipoprotein-sorting protein